MQSLNVDLKWQLRPNGWSDEQNISDYHSGYYLGQIGASDFCKRLSQNLPEKSLKCGSVADFFVKGKSQ